MRISKYPRKRIDWTWVHMVVGLFFLIFGRKKTALKKLDAAWGENCAAFFSVRTGWDAFLQSVDWEEGAIVLISAITIPHMRDIIVENGYVAVAIDIDPNDLTICEANLAKMLVELKPKALLFAHLFGSSADLKSIKTLCAGHNVLLIEDCAQSFNGPVASSVGDVAMYSFGTIKTCSAMGGAMFVFRDSETRDRSIAVTKAYPKQTRVQYAKKLIKGGAFLAISSRVGFSVFTSVVRDRDAIIRRWSRGFSGESWLQKMRTTPSSSLLAVLAHRTESFDLTTTDRRRKSGEAARSVFARFGHHIVGFDAERRTHWLLALRTDDPDRFVTEARRIGFDATRGCSTMVAIGGDRASAVMRSIVYIPCDAALGEVEYERLARILDGAFFYSYGSRKQSAFLRASVRTR